MPKKIYQSWYHGHDGWRFSQDCGLWYYQGHYPDPPTEYCLGNRYIHSDYGLDSGGIVWKGSTDNNWHGISFGYDLGKAIRWVRRAAAKNLGCSLWSKNNACSQGSD